MKAELQGGLKTQNCSPVFLQIRIASLDGHTAHKRDGCQLLIGSSPGGPDVYLLIPDTESCSLNSCLSWLRCMSAIGYSPNESCTYNVAEKHDREPRK